MMVETGVGTELFWNMRSCVVLAVVQPDHSGPPPGLESGGGQERRGGRFSQVGSTVASRFFVLFFFLRFNICRPCSPLYIVEVFFYCFTTLC